MLPGPAIDRDVIEAAVRAALDEDLGSGDLTTRAVVPPGTRARGRCVTREAIVVAGLPVAAAVFAHVDAALRFRPRCADGEALAAGAVLFEIEGPAAPALAAERTALNFLQRLSGIATATRRCVTLAGGTKACIADTRKTAPGLRLLDKYAVRAGGGTNHRLRLDDGTLIKDNHWRLAGGIAAALARARAARAAGTIAGPIAIEVGTPDEVDQAIAAGAEALLLDNMTPATLSESVCRAGGRVYLEVSGGIRPDDIPRIAALGVDRISIGSLTHSVRAVDLALEIEPA
jgi:nicotinate-nucleotide pyrophosphorylase (carboxylating)